MTRSMGDRKGPRSCVAVPDITAISIPRGVHARFVLASDGLWDVLGVEAVQRIAMSVKDPSVAAYKLSRRAWTIRLNESLYMDDITVVVVDVYPDGFLSQRAECQCAIT